MGEVDVLTVLEPRGLKPAWLGYIRVLVGLFLALPASGGCWHFLDLWLCHSNLCFRLHLVFSCVSSRLLNLPLLLSDEDICDCVQSLPK